MSLCILNRDGAILVHQNMQAGPAPFLRAIAPSREDLVVCVACLFTWYGLADLCAREGMPCVLGQALSRKAIHGGTAQQDQSDAQKMALLLRGGMLPQASVSPAERRATRDLLRRRLSLRRKRAALLAHIQHTTRQSTLPESGKKRASTANRDGVAERFSDPAVQQSSAVDLARSSYDARLLHDVELTMVNTAPHHDAHPFYRLQSVPGMGKILRLGMLDEIHPIARVPRVQDVVSYCRLVTCAKASAGTRDGPSGTKIGNAYVQWAFSEAAVLCLRDHPAGQTSLARREKKHGHGQAFTVLAQTLARAVYDLVTRDTVCAMATFLHGEGSGAGAPVASLGHEGISRKTVRSNDAPTASLHAHEPIGAWPCPCAGEWTPAPAPGPAAQATDR